jgi:hypothetical protein
MVAGTLIMTLLIASIRPQDALVTADGRCTVRTNGVVTGVDDHYQKLHPVPDHPILIAHHGDNLIGGHPVKVFLGGFFNTLNAGNHTLLQLADQLREYAHGPVRRRLKAVGKGTASGFWIIGFDDSANAADAHGERQPRGFELFWKWEGDHLSYEEREWRPTTLVAGGDGKKQIPALSWKEIVNLPLPQLEAHHKALMDAALKTEMKDNPVGGHVHELHLTAEKWAWTIKPPGA